jgi:golgi phosphoprotein 3
MAMLNLMEELLFLALREKGEKGRVKFTGIDLRYSLAGAALADLCLQGQLEWDEQCQVHLLNRTDGPDALLNDIAAAIGKARKPKSLSHWINALADNGKVYQKKVIANLVDKGLLQIEAGRYLWVIPYQVFTQSNASAKYQVKQRLRAIVLAGETPDEYALVLLSLVQASDLLAHVFTVDEIKSARKRVQTLAKRDAIGATIAEIMRDIVTTAVAAAVATV